jgi:hypothetical protein
MFFSLCPSYPSARNRPRFKNETPLSKTLFQQRFPLDYNEILIGSDTENTVLFVMVYCFQMVPLSCRSKTASLWINPNREFFFAN